MSTAKDLTVIVGAGPIGMTTAALLAAQQMPVLVLERRQALPRGSRAIGITPPSMEVFHQLGIAETLRDAGVPVHHAVVYRAPGTPVGRLSFARVHRQFPWILAVPQERTMAILDEHLQRSPWVTVERGRAVTGVAVDGPPETSGVTVTLEDHGVIRGARCIAADGGRSTVAAQSAIPVRRGDYRRHFFMADFAMTATGHPGNHAPLDTHAHLWFTPQGAVESFPLPDGCRRWIVQLTGDSAGNPGADHRDTPLEELVEERTGFLLNREERLWESHFSPEWSLAERFAAPPLYLAGDAAHTMSPIGGQGMNTGIGDARLLVEVLAGRCTPEEYSRVRRRAAQHATRRAALGMAVGTITGAGRSAVRSALIAAALHSPVSLMVARHFAMVTPAGFTPGASAGAECTSSHP